MAKFYALFQMQSIFLNKNLLKMILGKLYYNIDKYSVHIKSQDAFVNTTVTGPELPW